MALLGMRSMSSSLLSSSRMCIIPPLVSQTAKLRVNDISTINRFPTTRKFNGVVSSSLYKPLQSISVGRRHTCILYAQLFSASKSRFTLPTSSAKVAASTSKSKSSSSAVATKLQERQRLKWRIIARVAYYLRVSS